MALPSSANLAFGENGYKEKVVNKLKRMYQMIDCEHINTKVHYKKFTSLAHQDYDREFIGRHECCDFCGVLLRTLEQTPEGVVITDHIKNTKVLENYKK